MLPLARPRFTLDQLQVFLTVTETGSLSQAARKLGRAQSAVSFVIANLERMLDLKLFERGARGLTLTLAGQAIEPHARRIVDIATVLGRFAGDLAAGQEAEVLLAIDVLYPLERITGLLTRFAVRYPLVPVRLFVESLGGVARLVLDRVCGVGIIGSLPDVPAGLVATRLGHVDIVAVAAAAHPLATLDDWPDEALREHLQIVVTDRTTLSDGRDFAVFGGRTWRTSDLGAKRQMILAGLGWGALPSHIIASDLAGGRLVALAPTAWRRRPLELPVHRIRHADAPIGPATAYLTSLLDADAAHPGGLDDNTERSE